MFSTHPPLTERIRRIEPSWDGTFPALAPPTGRGIAAAPAAAGAAGFAGEGNRDRDFRQGVVSALDHVGQPTEAHIQYAARLLEGLPSPIVSAAREPHGARAVVYALLLDREAEPRLIQLTRLSATADAGVYQETIKLAPLIQKLDLRTRLPLLDIALPALRALTPAQYQIFKQNVAALVLADDAIDLFEWSLQRILLHNLERQHSKVKPARVRHSSLAPLQPQCELLLSMLAHAGHKDAGATQRAFEQARQSLKLPQARLRRAEECAFGALDVALATLEEAAPQIKRQILQAAVACVAADQIVTVSEAELLRATSASLGCPMPPLLPA